MVPAKIVALLETQGAEATCEHLLHRLSYVLSQPRTSLAIARAVQTVSLNGPQELALHTELSRRINFWTSQNSLSAHELLDGLQTAVATHAELPIKALVGRLEPLVSDLSSADCISVLRVMNTLDIDRPRLVSHIVERIASTSNSADLRLEALQLLARIPSARAYSRSIILLSEPGFPEDMVVSAVIALGRLNIFPPKFMASVHRLPATTEVLRALDRLQWRPPMLPIILRSIDPKHAPHNVLFSLMRLDVWDEALFMRSLDALQVGLLGVKELCKLLLAMCYFDVDHPAAHAAFRCLMAKVDEPTGPLHTQLMTIEVAMRTTHWQLRVSKMAYSWLQRMRYAELIPDEIHTSEFQKEIATFLSPLGFQQEVAIGPYTVDFKLERLVVEADGAQHKYRNSDELTALTKLRTRLLTRLGFTILHVPSATWKDLDDDEKGLFLQQLLEPHVQPHSQSKSL